MVDEVDLIKIEKVSNNLSQLIIYFESKIEKRRSLDRYEIRANSTFYQLLIYLNGEVNTLKSSTLIIPQQLEELKRKLNSLLRLADETNLFEEANNHTIDELQENIQFKAL